MKRILFLFMPDAPAGGGGAAKPVSDADKIKQLEAEVAGLKAEKAEAAADEQAILEKMSHGLSRNQAIHVINRQKTGDAAKKRRADIQKIANGAKSQDDFLAQLAKQFTDATDAEKAITPQPEKPPTKWK